MVLLPAEDDDGEGAMDRQPKARKVALITKAQAAELSGLVGSDNTLMKRILKGYNIAGLDLLPADRFDECKKGILFLQKNAKK